MSPELPLTQEEALRFQEENLAAAVGINIILMMTTMMMMMMMMMMMVMMMIMMMIMMMMIMIMMIITTSSSALRIQTTASIPRSPTLPGP